MDVGRSIRVFKWVHFTFYRDSCSNDNRQIYNNNSALYSFGLYFHHQSHPQLGVVLLWLLPFILYGVISPPISSSVLGTYRPGEFIFQCPIFLPFHYVHGILKARILNWIIPWMIIILSLWCWVTYDLRQLL